MKKLIARSGRILSLLSIWFCVLEISFGADPSSNTELFRFVMIKYDGGSWKLAQGELEAHANVFIPNFLRWVNVQKVMPVSEKVEVLELSDKRIFDHPLLYIAGHFDFNLTEPEKKNLKLHLERGGFLYIEDCGGTDDMFQLYGIFSKFIKKELKSLFPEGEFKVLPANHEIYRFPYEFPKGLPNVFGANNDMSPESPAKRRKGQGGEGFYYKGRMIAFFSDADNCCGWDPRPEVQATCGTIPFKMGANVLVYSMTH